VLLGSSRALAQDEPAPADSVVLPLDSLPADTATADTAVAPADTVIYDMQTELTRFAPATDSTDFERHLTQNPTVALFKSMVIPGWGQWGNRKYVKAILFAGVDAWLIASAINYGRKASDFYDKYQAATDVTVRNAYYDDYTNRRSSRNKYTWFAVIVSFVSMFDAYVDAHLSGFPTRSHEAEIGVNVAPDFEGGVKASVTVPF